VSTELIVTEQPKTITFPSKKVVIVMPWMKVVSPITAFCAARLMDTRRASALLNYGDSFVAHSRNSCVDAFLATKYEWMFTMDDDMVLPFGDPVWFNGHTRFNFPEPFASINILDRLMSHGKTLVGALYFGRQVGHSKPVYNEGASNSTEADFAKKAPMDLLKPTKWVGTGAMLVHRSVFEDIEKKFPLLARNPAGKGGNWFTSTEASFTGNVNLVRNMLAEGPLTSDKAYKALAGLEAAFALNKHENNLGCGEDVAFCMRAASSGHQPYVDFGAVCGHIGHFVYGPRNHMPV
jgi:hypothetical protein